MYKHIPNFLTLARLVLAVPLLFLLFLPPTTPILHALAVALATFCAITDTIDGKLARRWHCESDFGKKADPFADKILVLAFIPLCYYRMIHFLPVVILFLRDGFSILLRRQYPHQVIAAKASGKIKTVINLVFLCFLVGAMPVRDSYFSWVNYIKDPLYYASGWTISIICIWSGIDYYKRIVLLGQR